MSEKTCLFFKILTFTFDKRKDTIEMVMIMLLEELLVQTNIDAFRLVETIVDADLPTVVLFKNTKSEIVYVNKQFFHKHPEFKENPETVYGKTDFDLFPESIEHAKQAFYDEQEVLRTGKPINVLETEGKDKLGRTKIAHTKKFPVYDRNHEAVGILVFTEDITNDVSVLRENQEKNKILSKLNRELTQENTTDTLSQLYNRRFERAELDSLYNQFIYKDIPFSAILIDLDNFKRINDSFGHNVGDEVIHYIGEVLINIKNQIYPTIEPCRCGGDEFLILAPAYQKEGAIAIAKDIKEAFDNQMLHVGDFHEKVHLSMGVACIHKNESIHEFLERCDKYLYVAKNNGRNQICFEEEKE